jgi:hypothetical protein
MRLILQDRYTRHEVTASRGGNPSGRTAPKRDSSKINPERVACFSSPKNDRQLTSVSPAIHHKFTSEKPRSAPRFLPKPPAKRGRGGSESSSDDLFLDRVECACGQMQSSLMAPPQLRSQVAATRKLTGQFTDCRPPCKFSRAFGPRNSMKIA